MPGGRTTKPIIYFDVVSRQWVVQGKDGIAIITFGPDIVRSRQGMLVDGQATLPNANIGSTGVIQALRVAGTATITALNVGTLGNIRDLLSVNGTITNVNVGTLATLRALNVAGQASLGATDITTLILGGLGAGIGNFNRIIATLPLTNVGTLTSVVATMIHVGTSGANAVAIVNIRDDNLATGLVLGNVSVRADNNVGVRLVNTLNASVASQSNVACNLVIISP